MKTKEFLTEFIVIFFITFIVSSLVTFIYNLVVHSEGKFDLSTAFIFSITFGIIFPVIYYRERKKQNI
jgi:hypothetical protein